MPTLLAMDGCIGLSMLVDRNTGRCITTSAWRTREAMLASERQLRPLRDHAAEILGNRPKVEEWEIAVLHRDHKSGPGACVRASWVRMAPAQADRVVDDYRMALLPVMAGLSRVLQRQPAGRPRIRARRVVGDLRRPRVHAAQPRAGRRPAGGRRREAGVEIVEVCEFDLALAHLRVPEMA